jgi:hypothetical protein
MRGQLAEALAAHAAVQRELLGIQQSRSWRVTAPYRVLMGRFRSATVTASRP